MKKTLYLSSLSFWGGFPAFCGRNFMYPCRGMIRILTKGSPAWFTLNRAIKQARECVDYTNGKEAEEFIFAWKRVFMSAQFSAFVRKIVGTILHSDLVR